MCQKDYSWNPSTCICKDSKYLKSIADTSVMTCDEIISVMHTVSTKITDPIAANVMSTASIKYQSKKSKRLLYFARIPVSLVIIFLLIISIICYHYPKHR